MRWWLCRIGATLVCGLMVAAAYGVTWTLLAVNAATLSIIYLWTVGGAVALVGLCALASCWLSMVDACEKR